MAEPTFSSAISAHGTLFQMGDGGDPETFTTVSEVIDITGPAPERATLDVTNQSSGQIKEYIGALIDAGKVSFDVNYIPTDATQDASTGLLSLVLSGVRTNFKVIFPDAATTTWSFGGLVLGFAPSMGVDAILRTKIDIQVTGALTLA